MIAAAPRARRHGGRVKHEPCGSRGNATARPTPVADFDLKHLSAEFLDDS
jgi:hypothetical protein